jgi:ABC-2 type transport system permease protein
MSAIYILWLREIRRFTQSKLQILASFGQPVLLIYALGFGMNDVFLKAGRGSYLQFVTPGTLVMTVMFSASLSGTSILWDRKFGFLKETLIAPVPRIFIMLGCTLGVATVAVLQGVVVAVVSCIAGFQPASLAALPASVAFLGLIALAFAGFGTIVGCSLKNMPDFQLVMSFLLLPMFYFSGALYPLDTLPPALSMLTRLNPLSYGVDGLRSALIAQSQFSATLDAIVLLSFVVTLMGVGAWRFSKIEV